MGESEVIAELSQHEGFLLCQQIEFLIRERGGPSRSVDRVILQLRKVNALDVIESPRGKLYRLKDNIRYRLEKENGRG